MVTGAADLEGFKGLATLGRVLRTAGRDLFCPIWADYYRSNAITLKFEE